MLQQVPANEKKNLLHNPNDEGGEGMLFLKHATGAAVCCRVGAAARRVSIALCFSRASGRSVDIFNNNKDDAVCLWYYIICIVVDCDGGDW